MAGEEQKRTKTTAIKATETAQKVRGLVKNMNRRAQEAKATGQPVAYCMVNSQYDEILEAMGVVPVWTENYAALCAAKRVADRYINKAESDGYSTAVCGYVRTGVGFDATRAELGKNPLDAPDGGMPKPDLLLGSSAVCDPRFKWYQTLGRYMDVPTYAIDVVHPPVDADLNGVRDYYVKYELEQFKGLVSFIESNTKLRLNKDRLWETIKLGDEAWRLWYETDMLRKAIPGPMPSEDHFNAMVPGYFYCGRPEAVTFYQELYDEVKNRVENKIGVVENEKYRLLYGGGLPPWHTMWMFNYFESLGAVCVMENVYRSYDPVEVPSSVKDPLEYLAYRTWLRYTQRHEKARKRGGNPTVEKLLEYIEEYKVDGVVFHACRSCRATTVGELFWKSVIQKYYDLPAVQLESDMVDVRDYSEARWKSQINTFIEAVDASKSSRK